MRVFSWFIYKQFSRFLARSTVLNDAESFTAGEQFLKSDEGLRYIKNRVWGEEIFNE